MLRVVPKPEEDLLKDALKEPLKDPLKEALRGLGNELLQSPGPVACYRRLGAETRASGI